MPTCSPCFAHGAGVIHSLSWGKESVSLRLTPASVSLMWFPLIWVLAAHTAPCQSLYHSPGSSLCPASPASLLALVGWEGDFQFLFSFGNQYCTGVRHIPWGCCGVPLPACSVLIAQHCCQGGLCHRNHLQVVDWTSTF